MSQVSGFGPLLDALTSHLPDARSITVDQTNRQRSLVALGLRWAARFRSSRSEGSRGIPAPAGEERHERAGRAALADAAGKGAIVLSVGETQMGRWASGAGSELKRRLVVCVHQPPSWTRLHWRDVSVLNGVGAIVCLSSEQADYYREVVDAPVLMIRHGVRCDFFRPDPGLKSEDSRLLFVGQWLRDFDALESAYAIIRQKRPEVSLDCVVPHRARHVPSLLKLARHASVRWHANLSADQLLRLYQANTQLLLPLVDAAANNAIVEALACNLPVVTTSVGGIADYSVEGVVHASSPGDPAGLAETSLSVLERTQAHGTSEAGRAFALQYLDWSRIAESLIRDLSKVMQPGLFVV